MEKKKQLTASALQSVHLAIPDVICHPSLHLACPNSAILHYSTAP